MSLGGEDVVAKARRLDIEWRLRNAKLLGFGLAACTVPTVYTNSLVPSASLPLRAVPVVTFLLLASGGYAAHKGFLNGAVVGIVGGGALAMLGGVVTHPQLWASPYGLGLLVLAASTIASPRGVVSTLVVALGVLAVMGVFAWGEPQVGAPVAFTVVTAGVMLVMAALITLLQVRTSGRMTRELVEHERRRFEAERETDALRLELTQSQKLEALGQLAGGIAHDFNNYLQVMVASSQMAHDSLSREHPARKALEPALDAVEQAGNLTGQLLSFSRRQVLPTGRSDVRQVVLGMSHLLRTLVGRGIQLEIDVEPGEHFVALGSGQLQQVLMNLVLNARDAMDGSGRIRVEVRDESNGGSGYVRLSVSDTGPGMAPELRQRVFEPFFTTKPEGLGTGLGLPTCRRIVEQAGGALTIASELGRGATFDVRLPRL